MMDDKALEAELFCRMALRLERAEAEVERLRAAADLPQEGQHAVCSRALADAEAELERLKVELVQIEGAIPATFYAGVETFYRIEQLVRIWQNAVKSNTEAEEMLREEHDARMEALAQRDEARATKDMHKERQEEAWAEVARLLEIKVYAEKAYEQLRADLTAKVERLEHELDDAKRSRDDAIGNAIRA